MEFYGDILQRIRKDKKISTTKLAAQSGLSRYSIWEWETGRRTPSEKSAKTVAETLEIPISHISSLKDSKNIKGNKKLSEVISAWNTYAVEDNLKRYDDVISEVNSILKKMKLSEFIIKSFIDNIGLMMYFKDSAQKFILCNKSFRNFYKIDLKMEVLGSSDHRFFPKKDAEQNILEDEQIMLSGEPKIVSGHIPGSRKRKKGYICKYPIINEQKECSGIVGVYLIID